jgi:phage terminase small subunit
MKLSPKQQRFIDEYLVDLNASQAALRAGYSPKSARIIGQQLLAKPYIADAVTAAMTARAERVHLTQDAVLEELAMLSCSDIRNYLIDDHGNVLLRSGAPDAAMRAVASLKKKIVHTDAGISYETEIRLWNKPMSVRMAGEHLGLFKQQVDISGTVKVVRLPQKAPSAEAWYQERHPHAHGRTDLGSATEAN